jgi:hypothetical protein
MSNYSQTPGGTTPGAAGVPRSLCFAHYASSIIPLERSGVLSVAAQSAPSTPWPHGPPAGSVTSDPWTNDFNTLTGKSRSGTLSLQLTVAGVPSIFLVPLTGLSSMSPCDCRCCTATYHPTAIQGQPSHVLAKGNKHISSTAAFSYLCRSRCI